MNKLYAIKDAALGAFENLMPIATDAVAIRVFAQEANRKESQINHHPNDYDLYHIGAWDDRTGKLIPNEEPILVIRAVQIIEG